MNSAKESAMGMFFSKTLILILFTLLPIIGFFFGMKYQTMRNSYPNNIVIPEQKACTTEAKLCPDGSSVGRTGPNCEFAPCPTRNREVEEKSITYIACGCGCCGGSTPIKKCLYHSKGNLLDTIIQEDNKIKQNPQCSTMGCSLGIEYYYCD